MRRFVQDILVTALGAITSLLTVAILIAVEAFTGQALYTWMFWFIIPVGALLAGFAAASGYYLGSRLFNHKPDKTIMLSMVAIAFASYLLIEFVHYVTLTYEGKPISDLIPFVSYLDISIRSTSMEFSYRGAHNLGATGRLGGWGYGIALLQILGFSFGGLAVYGYLSGLIYCDRCSKYYSIKERKNRFFDVPDTAMNSYKEIAQYFHQFLQEKGAKDASVGNVGGVVSDKLRLAIGIHAQAGVWSEVNKRIKSFMELKYCKGCGRNHLKYALAKKDKDSRWEEVSNTVLEVYADDQLGLDVKAPVPAV